MMMIIIIGVRSIGVRYVRNRTKTKKKAWRIGEDNIDGQDEALEL